MAIQNGIKSIAQIENGIDKLSSIKSSDDDAYEKMYNTIISDLHPIPFPTADIVPNTEYSYVFRVRRNKGNEVFKNITRIASISDLQEIKKFGRCNMPKQSTFYCSENRAVSNMEVINKEILDNSEYIKLTNGRWKINKKLTLAMLIHSEDVIKVNPFIKQRYEEFQILLDEAVPNHKPVINRLLGFFSDYFSRPFDDSLNDEYKLSAAFYNYVLNYVDGLIYPSVKIIYEGLNYAFPHERFIQDYVELDRAMITVLKKDNDGKGFTDFYMTEDRGIMKEADYIRWYEGYLPHNKLDI